MINKEDLATWLNDPCTKFLKAWIEKDRDTLKISCVDKLYHNYHSLELNKIAAKEFGICNGLDRILDLFSDIEEQIALENQGYPADKIQDIISSHINFVTEEYEPQ